MKRILLLLIAIALVAVTVSAQETIYEPKFNPQTPEVMGQGGSFLANAHGINSLYTNPAGFSSGKPSLTILSANPWLYMYPTEESIAALMSISEDPAGGINSLYDQLTGSGTGLGVQAGMGFVGNGFGVGFIMMNDTFAYGQNFLGVTVSSAVTAALMAGISIPFEIGEFTSTPGLTLRPMYRMRAYDIGITSFLNLVTGDAAVDANVLAGTGLAFDLGLNVAYGPLTAALAVRDVGGTKMDYGVLTFDELTDAVNGGEVPEGEPIGEDTKFVIPASLHFGFMFHPDLGGLSFLLDPYVHAEYAANVGEGIEAKSFWSNLHLGAEIRTLKFISLRAGLNQGYVTLGAGVKLLFLEAHVAFFSRELGDYPGARQNPGVTAEVALRF